MPIGFLGREYVARSRAVTSETLDDIGATLANGDEGAVIYDLI